MLYFASEEFSGWLGQMRPERLSIGNQFVGQMDRPSTSLNSIRSEMVKKTTSACVITRLSYGKEPAHHKLSLHSRCFASPLRTNSSIASNSQISVTRMESSYTA